MARTTSQTSLDRSHATAATLPWRWLAPGVALLIAAFFDFFQLTANGYGNLYYAAAVKSMLTSWHTFFFVSFDAGGFVSVDKPPIDLWAQAASAKLFGFSPFSLLLPQALAGVLSVALLYYLVQHTKGVLAGFLAALALALTPISVVANRANIVDSLLVLTVLAAAWAVSKASETGRLRWLLLCAALVGLGFNIKMLQAYLVVPAFALVYLLGAPLRWRARLAQLALAGVVLVIVSFSWAEAVDLTPASQRPYVGSSTANSEVQLALGYNGLERLVGFAGFGRRAAGPAEPLNAFARGFMSGENGAPGPFRLLDQQLGGQVSWLLPLAVIGLLAICWRYRPQKPPEGWRAWRPAPLSREQQGVTLWGMWLLTQVIFFSVAGFFHAYYLVMLAPAICALFGIGVLELWSEYRRSGWEGWLLPAALVITALVQARLVADASGWNSWLGPLLVALCLASACALVIVRLADRRHLPAWLRRLDAMISESTWHGRSRLLTAHLAFSAVIAAIGVFTLLLAPTAWSIASVQHNSGMLPIAGPPRQRGIFADLANMRVQADPRLVNYLEAHRNNARYLVATPSAMQAAPIILDTNQPVMAMGGFAGSDPILTPASLAKIVQRGEVRFFLLSSNPLQGMTPAQIAKLSPELRELLQAFGGARGRGFGQSSLTSWVAAHCATVPRSQWSSSDRTPGAFPGFGGSASEKLFVCGDQHAGG
ncbi:MAG TPA: glycosyltransferase family 39 protein [Ktedonobacterales bacterium]|nr:glycosyltransferase family 39 protein [Ktedonobacterales bacterium]